MPRKEEPITVKPPTVEEQLESVLEYLRRAERRDRLRTTGGFIRGILGVAWSLILIGSAWYFVAHGEELMKSITEQAIQQSADYSQQSLMDQLNQYMQPSN